MKHFTFVSGANQHGDVLAIVKSAACDNGAIVVRLRRVYSVDLTLFIKHSTEDPSLQKIIFGSTVDS